MYTHIKTHFSRRQFRLLLLLLITSTEYALIVVPGTFAQGVEQLFSVTDTTISPPRVTITPTKNPANLTQNREKRSIYMSPPETLSAPKPVKVQVNIASSNQGDIGSIDKDWISFPKKNIQTTIKKDIKDPLPIKGVANTTITPSKQEFVYPTTPITELTYAMTQAFPSGNPGLSIQSTSDVPEGGSLYFTDARAQSALSGSINLLTTHIGSLSGSLQSVIGNINTLSGIVSSKIQLTSLSSSGGISYNSTTGVFSDLFSFGSGLVRVGNTISVSSIASNKITGLLDGQIPFGSMTGGISQSSRLFWNNTANRLGIGTNNPGATLDVQGEIRGLDRFYLTRSGSYAEAVLQTYSNTDWHGSRLAPNRYRGTPSAPLRVQSGDRIFWFDPWAYDGMANQRSSELVFRVDGTVSPGIVPGAISMSTVGQDGINRVRLDIRSSGNIIMAENFGNVGIGTSTPGFKLSVNGTNSREARTIGINNIPVIFLPDQGTGTGQFDGSLAIGDGLRTLSNTTSTEGRNNTSVGIGALIANGTGQSNTAVGRRSLRANISGINNTAIGREALMSNTSGDHNTGIGVSALRLNTTGRTNVAIGTSTLQSNTTAGGNTSIGNASLFSNTIGWYNTVIGELAAYNNTTGQYNTVIGRTALYNSATGSNNVIIGANSARLSNSGSNLTNIHASVMIGDDARAQDSGQENQIVIGQGARGIGSNSVVLGNDGITKTILKGNIGIGTNSPSSQLHTTSSVRFAGLGAGTVTTDLLGNLSVSSDERLKDKTGNFTKGVQSILGINPISYRWNSISGLDTVNMYYGFSAQNIQENIPEAISQDKNGYLTLSDRPILATLVNSVKELHEAKASTGSLEALSGNLMQLSYKVGTFLQDSEKMKNIYNQTGAATTSIGLGWIDTVFSYISSLMVRVNTIFSEGVTFMKPVIFQGTVTFEDRIIFSDRDMAGTVVLERGQNKIRITFEKPYSDIPKIIITSDSFMRHRVLDRSGTGFTIETEVPTTDNIHFDWIAIISKQPERSAQTISYPVTMAQSEMTSSGTQTIISESTGSSTSVDASKIVENIGSNSVDISSVPESTGSNSVDISNISVPIDTGSKTVVPEEVTQIIEQSIVPVQTDSTTTTSDPSIIPNTISDREALMDKSTTSEISNDIGTHTDGGIASSSPSPDGIQTSLPSY